MICAASIDLACIITTAIAAFLAGRLHERWIERRRNSRPRPQPRFRG